LRVAGNSMQRRDSLSRGLAPNHAAGSRLHISATAKEAPLIAPRIRHRNAKAAPEPGTDIARTTTCAIRIAHCIAPNQCDNCKCLSMPFSNADERDLHYAKHGHNFHAADPLDYERMADLFMFGQMALTTSEGLRTNGADRVRFNSLHRHFGAANITPEYVKTFYEVPAHTIKHHGGSRAYFEYELNKV